MLNEIRVKLRWFKDNLLFWFWQFLGQEPELQYTLHFKESGEDSSMIPLPLIARRPSLYYMAIDGGMLDVHVDIPSSGTRTGEEAWTFIMKTLGVNSRLFFATVQCDTKYITQDGEEHTTQEIVDEDDVKEIMITGTFTPNDF